MTTSITIRPLDSDRDAEAFGRLNRRWISQLFTMTPEDERVLSRPRESIIAPGGQVLVGVDARGTVVGVVAVLVVGRGLYELAKMTVDDAARGRGLGGRLVEAAIDWARGEGGELLFLGTSTRLDAAVRRYEAAGFERTTRQDLGLHDYYARADVLMSLELTPR